MKTKRCSHCKQTDVPLMKYSKTIRNGKVHQYYRCRKCAAKIHLAYYKTPEGRKHIYLATMKSYAKILGYKLTKIES